MTAASQASSESPNTTGTGPPAPSGLQTAARWLLSGALMFAGFSHLTSKRQDFQAQVPKSLPLDRDFVVLASGVVELSLGAALIVLRPRRTVGRVAAAFFVAVFPGNVSQYLTRTPAFGLNTDRARLVRLTFQPLLVLWALWSTDALAREEARRN